MGDTRAWQWCGRSKLEEGKEYLPLDAWIPKRLWSSLGGYSWNSQNTIRRNEPHSATTYCDFQSRHLDHMASNCRSGLPEIFTPFSRYQFWHNFAYKQQKGRTTRSGNNRGTKMRDVPHVTVLPKILATMTARTEKDTAKHPPRVRCWQKMVVWLDVLIL